MQDEAAGAGDAPEQQEVVEDSDAPDQHEDAGDKEESILGNLSPISGDASTMDTEEYNRAMKELEDEEHDEEESAPPKEVFATMTGLEQGTDKEITLPTPWRQVRPTTRLRNGCDSASCRNPRSICPQRSSSIKQA
jgi:hypothetical protein